MNVSMKNFLIVTVLFSSVFFVSCKFDHTAEGTYYGNFYSTNGIPFPYADGELVFTETGDGKLNMVLTSTGNPTFYLNGLTVKRANYGFGISWFQIELSTSNISFTANVYEVNPYSGKKWTVDCAYGDSIYSFEFDGKR